MACGKKSRLQIMKDAATATSVRDGIAYIVFETCSAYDIMKKSLAIKNENVKIVWSTDGNIY